MATMAGGAGGSASRDICPDAPYNPAMLPEANEWTGAHIAAFRAVAGLSRADLADAIGGSERSLYRWEHNQVTPRPLGLRAIRQLAVSRLSDAEVEVFLRELGCWP